ncbi:MAG: SUMF1/EgtB/PvdO family nonheme iron enzyme [Caldilineaceae bacterium]
MPTSTWLSQARQSLANFVQTIEDWAPSTLYGAVAGAAILPLLATSGDPKEALAGIVGGLGADLIANQLEAWKDRSNGKDEIDATAFAKQLSDAARNDANLRTSLDDLLRKIGALEVVIKNAADDERKEIAAQLDRQFAKIQSTLDVHKIYVGGDWITVGDISNSQNVAIGAGAHAGDIHYHYEQDPEIAVRRNARRQAYLNHVYEEASRLSLGGINRKAAESESEVAIPLDAIYTALWTEQSDGGEEMLPGKRQSAEGMEERQRPKLSAVAQLDRHARLVLLGTAGSGKSTFVNYVAQCLAGQTLGMSNANLATLIQALPDDVEKMANNPDQQSPRQPWSHNSLLPVRVILRHFAATHLPSAGTTATADHLWQHICADLAAAALAEFADDLKAELHTNGGLLLLDGLDEVPDADQQREQLKAVINDFAASFGKCRILITSRPYAYKQESWKIDGFVDTTLASFSDPQIRHFIDRWYEHIAPLRNYKSDDAKGRAERLKKAIFDSERLHVLAEQPLLLTLMASLHAWHGSDLPDKRERLYAEAVDLLLERWEKQRIERRGDGTQLVQPSLQEYLQVGRETILGVLEQIAYEVHAGQANLEGCADIPVDTVVQRLYKVSNNPQVKLGELINYLSQRAGLLLPEGNTLFRFPHRTFQEYLAALYLTEGPVDFPQTIADLLHQDPERWREVALLAIAGAVGKVSSLAWATIDAFCPFAPTESAFTLADAWGAQIAGRGLLESAKLENLSVRNEEKVERVRQGLIHVMRSGKFSPPERALAGRTLAGLGDPRFDPHRWFLPNDPLLGFIEIPGGQFIMGSNKELDPQARDDETPQHKLNLPTFYIARFPVTVAQFRASGIQPSDKDAFADPDNHPVRWINWYEALSYCNWLDQTLRNSDQTPPALAEKLRQGWKITLPSEAEWEKAARGVQGQIYPWAVNDIDAPLANDQEAGIGDNSAVGCFPAGASPYSVEEMAGNVWEWTRSLWGKDRQKPEFGYPYKDNDGRENLTAPSNTLRVLRGGANYNDNNAVRCAVRNRHDPNVRGDYYGFRVIASPFTSGI